MAMTEFNPGFRHECYDTILDRLHSIYEQLKQSKFERTAFMNANILRNLDDMILTHDNRYCNGSSQHLGPAVRLMTKRLLDMEDSIYDKMAAEALTELSIDRQKQREPDLKLIRHYFVRLPRSMDAMCKLLQQHKRLFMRGRHIIYCDTNDNAEYIANFLCHINVPAAPLFLSSSAEYANTQLDALRRDSISTVVSTRPLLENQELKDIHISSMFHYFPSATEANIAATQTCLFVYPVRVRALCCFGCPGLSVMVIHEDAIQHQFEEEYEAYFGKFGGMLMELHAGPNGSRSDILTEYLP